MKRLRAVFWALAVLALVLAVGLSVRRSVAGAVREKREDRQKRGRAHQKLVHVLHGRMAGGKAAVDQHGQRAYEGERVKAKG